MPRRSVKRIKAQRVHRAQARRLDDVLAVEEPLEIRLVFGETGRRIEHSISITMRTPGDDFELAAGFLYSEGIIHSHDDVDQIAYCLGPEKEKQEYNVVSVQLSPGVRFDPDRLLRHFYMTSSCGVCGKASLEALQIGSDPALPPDRPAIAAEIVPQLADRLRQAQSVFEKTGGLHAAALFDVQGSLVSLREDVGRHNAVDKIIGERLLANKFPLFDHVMMVSGRAGFEIMQKALVAGIPLVVAVGAPSSLAVELAREFGMTLLGFARGDGFNIYAGAQRVKFTGSSA